MKFEDVKVGGVYYTENCSYSVFGIGELTVAAKCQRLASEAFYEACFKPSDVKKWKECDMQIPDTDLLYEFLMIDKKTKSKYGMTQISLIKNLADIDDLSYHAVRAFDPKDRYKPVEFRPFVVTGGIIYRECDDDLQL